MTEETDLARMARIGDSVFAVVVTLLAYRVRIPSHEALTGGQLAPLKPFLTDLAAVVMSFIVASMFWIGHWRVFRRMQRSDYGFVALNLAFLGTLILLPISTSVMSVAGDSSMGALAYSANLFLLATAETFFRRYARRLDPRVFGSSPLLLSTSLLMLLFGGAAIVSLVWPAACPALWSMAIVVPLVENRWGLGRTV
jgi:uncharacterized membrane protein